MKGEINLNFILSADKFLVLPYKIYCPQLSGPLLLYSPVIDADRAYYGGLMLYTEIHWIYREKFYSDADIIFKQLQRVCKRYTIYYPHN
jgi:hypothetical protein